MSQHSYSNQHQIPLSVALWLMTNDYEQPKQTTAKNISVTGLLKSTREIILSGRVNQDQNIQTSSDISDVIASKFGSLLHKGVEDAWVQPNLHLLAKLGISKDVINRIKINPTEVTEDDIPIYLEQRSYKTIGDWTISGKYDFVFNGQVQDLKTTSVYKYMNAKEGNDFAIQASLYRWLNPDIITENDCAIIYLFTDWKALDTYKEGYPKIKIASRNFNLMTKAQTESFVNSKLHALDYYADKHERELPLCNDNELWMSDSQFKYYKSGVVSARSTATKPTRIEVEEIKQKNAGAGLIVEVKGQVRKCLWCNAAALCSQRADLEASGMLQPRKTH